jgi:uncharacterized coiled-coil protein SlyX
MLMPYDRPKLAPQLQTIEGINNILTQMDGRTKINQNAFCYRLRELYTEFEDFTDFFDDLRAHAKQN